jgi:hypothetical protein
LKASFLDLISPRCKKLAVWTAAALLFYTVVGFFLLPPIVRVIAVKQLSEHLDPAGHDSEGLVESVQALGHHPRFSIKVVRDRVSALSPVSEVLTS